MKNAELTVPEAARRKGCTMKYIYDLLQIGRLAGARKVGRRWVIPEESVHVLHRQREHYVARPNSRPVRQET